MVKITKLVTSRPVVFFFSLGFLVVVFGTISVTIWHTTTKNISDDVASLAEELRSGLVFDIENIGKSVYPETNSSTIGLARVIDYHLTNNKNDTQFTEIQTQIAPVLFQAYSTISHVSQVSYISTDGLLFSYITKPNKTVSTVFANSSIGGGYTWYTQTVDQITGRLIGNAIKSKPLNLTGTDWYKAAERNHTTGFVGTGLGGEGNNDNETLFQNVVSLNNKKGVVLLGFPVKALTENLNHLDLHGGEFYLWSKDGTVLVREGSLNGSLFIFNGSACFVRESKSGKALCIPENCNSGSRYEMEIGKSKFEASCSVLEVSGVPLRYTLMFPNNKRSETSIIKGNASTTTKLLIAMMILALLWPLGFVICMVEASRREMHIRSTLITQMEATQQAERKSMNKSQAFARASHDIRGSLAGINGLIDLCREEVIPGSELDTSLKQVNDCTQELVALLNSVLDMSKIESGKMHLEEEYFNLGKLLEDVTDLFHPVAMKKGVEVVLDLTEGTVFRFGNVIGDSGKLKQILNNLVGNAVKFTDEGRVSIRAWAKRPGSKRSLVLEESKGTVSKFSTFLFGKKKDQHVSSSSSSCEMDIMEFVFEVDDTGKGIPIEMQKSVFENYVQVRETAQGTEGTGLGLGIVQSLVRLMGGEIRIIDKGMGEKGTCFQFNVLLALTSESSSSSSEAKLKQDIETGGGGGNDYTSTPKLGLTINTSMVGGSSSSGMNIRNLSPRFNSCLPSSPKRVPSRVVLLIKDEERRMVTERHIKSIGIKVTVVEEAELLNRTLESLLGYSPSSNELSSSSSSSKELPLANMDGLNQTPRRRRNNSYAMFVLLVIDAKTGEFSKIFETVEQFRRGLQDEITCQVVWLNEPNVPEGDMSYMKPFHGSRLNNVLKMLPELGGEFVINQEATREIQEDVEEESYNKKLGKTIMGQKQEKDTTNWSKSVRKTPPRPIENEEEETKKEEPSNAKLFLKGKKVLVVDDNNTTRMVGVMKLKKMGASEVKQCESGKEALRLVSEGLVTQSEKQDGLVLPFDYIFMDLEMPEMDGYTTAKEIRKEEKKFGMHIPIIAVSGHEPGSNEAMKALRSGMDGFVEKDLKPEQLMNLISVIEKWMSST